MSNLKLENTNNNKNFVANIGSPAVQQYIQKSGQQILGISTFTPTNIQPKETKSKGYR